MSVAIVAMVNQTALERDPTIPDDECEGYYTPAANTTVHVSIPLAAHNITEPKIVERPLSWSF